MTFYTRFNAKLVTWNLIFEDVCRIWDLISDIFSSDVSYVKVTLSCKVHTRWILFILLMSTYV
jgi:hypothetical protein